MFNDLILKNTKSFIKNNSGLLQQNDFELHEILTRQIRRIFIFISATVLFITITFF